MPVVASIYRLLLLDLGRSPISWRMPEIDLEPHEYQRQKREKQPVLLPGGKAFLLYLAAMIVLGIVITALAAPIVDSVLDAVWPVS